MLKRILEVLAVIFAIMIAGVVIAGCDDSMYHCVDGEVNPTPSTCR